MIIDTNGFNGVIFVPYSLPSGFEPMECKFVKPLNAEIFIEENRIYFKWKDREMSLPIESCFYNKSDCQLACDRLNGISHD